MTTGNRVGGSGESCFVCNSSQILEELKEDGGALKRKKFAVKYLLEMPLSTVGFQNQCSADTEYLRGSLEDGIQLIRFCEQCQEWIKNAEDLYRQAVELVKNYRNIQRKIVEEIRTKCEVANIPFKDRRVQIIDEMKKFIRQQEYNFAGPILLEEINEETKEELERYPDDNDDESVIPDEYAGQVDSMITVKDPLSLDRNENTSDVGSDDGADVGNVVKIEADLDGLDEGVQQYSINAVEEYAEFSGCESSEKPNEKVKLGDVDINNLRHSNRQKQEVEQRQVINDKDEIPKKKLKTVVEEGRFPCTVCGHVLNTKIGLQSHSVRYHSGKTKHKLPKYLRRYPKLTEAVCSLCGETVAIGLLLEHVRNHVGDEYLRKCPNPSCPMVFPHYIALRSHLSPLKNARCCKFFSPEDDKKISVERNARLTLLCEICNVRTTNFEKLQAHLHRNHEKESLGNNKLQCPISGCTETFYNRQSVEVHMYLSHDQTESQKTVQHCSKCMKKVKVGLLEDHFKTEHGAERLFKCSHCPYMSDQSESLFNHQDREHPHSKIPFPCDICRSQEGQPKIEFPTTLELRQHYFNEHQIGRIYVCEKCGQAEKERTFWRKQDFYIHQRSRHTEYTCDICDGLNASSNGDIRRSVSFKTEEALTTHKIKVHGAEPFHCSNCGETFARKKKLNEHIREVHKGISKGSFRCVEQGCHESEKLFSTKVALLCHVKRKHNGGQGLPLCSDCGKNFSTKTVLKSHYESVHLGLRPYVCETCGESFTSNTVLKRHVLIHTGDRPHVCSQCGKQYRHRTSLQNHLKTHELKTESVKPDGSMKHSRKRKTNTDKNKMKS